MISIGISGAIPILSIEGTVGKGRLGHNAPQTPQHCLRHNRKHPGRKPRAAFWLWERDHDDSHRLGHPIAGLPIRAVMPCASEPHAEIRSAKGFKQRPSLL